MDNRSHTTRPLGFLEVSGIGSDLPPSQISFRHQTGNSWITLPNGCKRAVSANTINRHDQWGFQPRIAPLRSFSSLPWSFEYRDVLMPSSEFVQTHANQAPKTRNNYFPLCGAVLVALRVMVTQHEVFQLRFPHAEHSQPRMAQIVQ